MSGNMYGYARVSTREQNEERQLIALRDYGVEERDIYVDKASGKDFDRPQYRRLLRRLHRGDVLVIPSIDRLGRSYQDILEHWRLITRKKRADIVVLDMPLLNTCQDRDLMGAVIGDIVLQLLSYVAQTEREQIRSRQREGIAAAKARGVRFGPAPMPRPAGYEACRELWQSGLISAREAGRRLGVTHKTFLKWAYADGAERERF